MALPMRTKHLYTHKRQATFKMPEQRIVVLEGIARGEMAVAEGRVLTHVEAKARMARWLKR